MFHGTKRALLYYYTLPWFDDSCSFVWKCYKFPSYHLSTRGISFLTIYVDITHRITSIASSETKAKTLQSGIYLLRNNTHYFWSNIAPCYGCETHKGNRTRLFLSSDAGNDFFSLPNRFWNVKPQNIEVSWEAVQHICWVRRAGFEERVWFLLFIISYMLTRRMLLQEAPPRRLSS